MYLHNLVYFYFITLYYLVRSSEPQTIEFMYVSLFFVVRYESKHRITIKSRIHKFVTQMKKCYKEYSVFHNLIIKCLKVKKRILKTIFLMRLQRVYNFKHDP